jgi:hypothetical protein
VNETRSDARDEVKSEKDLAAPHPLDFGSERPQGVHVQGQMQQSAVKKEIRKELPQV